LLTKVLNFYFKLLNFNLSSGPNFLNKLLQKQNRHLAST